MVQQEQGGDYILASGETRAVRSFVDAAAEALGFRIGWDGNAQNCVARDLGSGRIIVRIDPEFYRPAEVDRLVGSADKARRELGWQPATSFELLVGMMAEADAKCVRGGSSIQ